MVKIEDYEVCYDGQDAGKTAHIYERSDSQPVKPTALCGAARPANQRPSQQGTRPPNPVCARCERILEQRGGSPLNPPLRR